MNLLGFKGLLGAYNGPWTPSFGYLNVDVTLHKVEVLNPEIASSFTFMPVPAWVRT